MSRTAARNKARPAPTPKAEAGEKGKSEPEKEPESYRETIESIVVAFILALLIRGFEAEAFVIPTGSMAPTLMGRHKEISCPQCGHVYAVNASEESELVQYGTCVNCRYQARIDEAPSFKGDRILVMKFLYDLPFLPGASPPQRWDVVVFKYPEDPETNYIKRLVGLPGEELRISHGDIFTRPRNSQPDVPYHMERKPLRHQQAMQILVYDDTQRPRALQNDAQWKRWESRGGVGWAEGPDATYAVDATAQAGWAELRYQHLVPDPAQWRAILEGRSLPQPPRKLLITDFYSYNTNTPSESFGYEGTLLQQHWVGDLTVSLRLEVTSAQGKARIDLVEGGVVNRCEIDLAGGDAVLYHGNQVLGRASTRIRGKGTYDLEFANVDDRLTLWVNGDTPFESGIEYNNGPNPEPLAPTEADLEPAAVALEGGSGRVSGLVLKRDIYYTQRPGQADYELPPGLSSDRARKYFDLLADPSQYAALVPSDSEKVYPIHPGRYMMMGDNSPRSKDGRGWDKGDKAWDELDRETWEVPESLLIGKAFFVYWPHGKPFGPDIRVNRDIRLPFRPYFERMKWIR